MTIDSLIRVRHARATSLGGVVMAGHIRASTGIPDDPMRVLGSYAIVYVLAGGGRFADGTGFTTAVTAGDLLLLFPDVPHSYGPADEGQWSELYIVFDGPVFDLWRDVGLLDPARPIRHLEPVDRWGERFAQVLSPHPQPGLSTALAEICRLQAVLGDAVAGAGTGTGDGDGVDDGQVNSDDQLWLSRATALLEADTRREAALEDIAVQLGYTYHGFRKRFRRLAGMSPARFRSLRSIDRSCELMAEGEWSDRQIAAELGYCDEFHFSHRFKELTGRTPRQFRAALPYRKTPLPTSGSESTSFPTT